MSQQHDGDGKMDQTMTFGNDTLMNIQEEMPIIQQLIDLKMFVCDEMVKIFEKKFDKEMIKLLRKKDRVDEDKVNKFKQQMEGIRNSQINEFREVVNTKCQVILADIFASTEIQKKLDLMKGINPSLISTYESLLPIKQKFASELEQFRLAFEQDDQFKDALKPSDLNEKQQSIDDKELLKVSICN